MRLTAVFVHLGTVLLAVRQAARAADAAADAGHALDKVGVQHVAARLEQRHAAGLDAVARAGLEIEIDALLLESLGHSVAQAAAAGKDAPEVRGVVQHVLFHRGDVQIAAVKERLQLLKRQRHIHPFADAVLLNFHLLGRARADEDDLRAGRGLLDIAGDHRHGREIVGDVVGQLGEGLADIGHKRRAAGAGQKALLGQFLRFGLRHHVRAQRRLDDGVEAQLLKAGDDLTQLGIGELAGNGGRHDGVNLIAGLGRFLEQLDRVQYERFVHDRAEGALIDARAAGDALFIEDRGRLVLVHCDGLDLAGVLTGTLAAHDGRIGADLGAHAALHALRLVDVRHMVLVEIERLFLTHIVAAVRQTAAAGLGDFIAAHGTFVAGDVDDLDDVGIVLVAAHRQLDALAHDGALLIDTAAHRRFFSGHDDLRNVEQIFRQRAIPRLTGHLPQNLIFEMLNLCVELMHGHTHPFHTCTHSS